jgi:hypothetical protein
LTAQRKRLCCAAFESETEMNLLTIDTNTLIGLTEAEAVSQIEKAGMIARVMERNGEDFIGTCEYRTDRVNLQVANDTVYKVSIG